jgi:hypothetical protein
MDVTGSLDFESISKYPKAAQKEIAAGCGSHRRPRNSDVARGRNSLNFEVIR